MSIFKTALAALLLFQARNDDPSAALTAIDSAVRAIPGYTAKPESKPIGDAAFLKRIMKDLVDAAPSDAESKTFVDDTDAKKRLKKINQLLEDDRFANFWAGRFAEVYFGDIGKARFSMLSELPTGGEIIILGNFTLWLATKIKKDTPWSEVVSQMLDARGTSDGDPAMGYLLSFNRGKGLAQEFAEGVSRHHLGIRLTCARCHDHPYDKWGEKDYYGMAAFVARQKLRFAKGVLELKYADSGELKMPTGSYTPSFLYGQKPGANDDWMKQLGWYMTDRMNPQFPRALSNRVWGWLFGAGVVSPVDDFNATSGPLSKTLLDLLQRDTVDNKFSLKRLVRVICSTSAYAMPTPEEAPDGQSFRHLALARSAPRRLPSPTGALPLKFDAPAEWTRVKPGSGAKASYLVAGKADKSRIAELSFFDRKLGQTDIEGVTRAMELPKTQTEAIEGKLKGSLLQISGSYFCQRGSDGPIDYRVWVANLQAGEKNYAFKFAGPVDLLESWREEFMTMLKGAK
jgi:hypothetical protein